MLPAAFNIRLDGDTIVSGPLHIPVDDPTKPILVAITEAYTAAHGAHRFGAFEFGILRWSPSDGSDDYLAVRLDLTNSTKRFYEAFGPLASSDPPVLALQVDGIGGDGELASLAGDASKVYRIVKGVLSIRDSFRYKEHRREIEDWEDSGIVTMRLRQLVLTERTWDPKEFTRLFGVRGRDRATLLGELGFKVTKRDGRKTWIETAPG